ncbi:putative transcription factor bZIP family [Helianthus anomalus]
MSTPTHEQPVTTSPHILQTPPTSQPPVQTAPGSSGLKDFLPVPENIALEDIGDFNFVTDDLRKKMLEDREKKLEDRVKTVEAENSSLLKKIEADQAEIDILKVRIAELEEEKARRDEQNEYFKLKNKELEAINAKKEHEMYMMNKVLENLIGKPVEQRFEEIELEEVRARRKAEIEAEMKNKGKGVQVEGVSEVTERAIVLSIVPESPIRNPCPTSSVSGVFDDDVEIDDVEDDDEEEDDDEKDGEEIRKDDADDVYSANSDQDDDDNDDNDQGSTGIKVTEASNEEKIDKYLHDDANEEPENAEGEGELDDTEKDDENVDHVKRMILHLEHGVEEGEILHTYSLAVLIKMTHIDENEFKFDFEEELNKFDIN